MNALHQAVARAIADATLARGAHQGTALRCSRCSCEQHDTECGA